jgi:hypothetical protein
MTQLELKTILENHKKWLNNEKGGVCADLVFADLRHADLRNADLSGADLRDANLSGAKNLLSSINYLDENFEKTTDGYVAYKTFNSEYKANEDWKLKVGAVINEAVNPNRQDACGCGINVAPLKWVKEYYKGEIWKVLIRWEWLAGVIVPYSTDGKIRCERVELIETMEETK